MSETISPAPRRRRKEARPSELTAAALALFVDKGFAATKLEEVAARAGVSKGTLYLYFDSKEALFQAVIREGVIPVVERGEQLAAAHTGSAFDLLSGILLGWWEMLGDTHFAGIPKLMVAEAQNFPEVAAYYYANVIRRGRTLIAAALQKGMESGEFRTMNVDACVETVVGPILTMLVWRRAMSHCSGAQIDPRVILETQLEILRQGLMAR